LTAALPPAIPDAEATDVEVRHMIDMCRARGARILTLGHGRTPPASRTASRIARHWEAAGGVVATVVSWPQTAASWLRHADRFTAAEPDLWIMTGPAAGWIQMARRLLWSTPWQPARTLATADIGVPAVIDLVGAENVAGLAGATMRGGTWTVADGGLHIM
jgi:hypothetical protein